MPSVAPHAVPSRTVSHRIEGDVLYVRHNNRSPADAHWDELIEEVREYLKTRPMLRILVSTKTSGPSARQRAQINQVVREANATVRVAVLSASTVVRGIVTALSWANVIDIRSFQPHDVAGGLAFLGVEAGRQSQALRILEELGRAVGV